MYSFKSVMAGCSAIIEPSCSVCTEPFDDDKHVPKILQCAHTVCSMCLGLLEELGRQNSGLLNLDQNYIYMKCPTCRYSTQVPRSCIRTNYQLMDVVQSIKTSDKLSYNKCTSCGGRYHETDMNICTTCTSITFDQNRELLEQDARLDEHVVCSTCLLRDHISNGHVHFALQKMRVEMQRVVNTRRIAQQQVMYNKAHERFREAMALVLGDWKRWEEDQDAEVELFQCCTSTAQQKEKHGDVVKLISGQTDRLELLAEHIEKWRVEMAKLTTPARPPTPVYVQRPQTPGPVEELLYLEHRA